MPASPEAWRCFVAVPAPADLRAALEKLVAAWRREPDVPDLRWTDPDGWHVTLAFLGQTDADAVPDLTSRLAAAASVLAPFRAATSELGAFPRPGAAQSVWLGIEDREGRLGDLAAAVQAAVLDPEARRPLRAHLTLGRSRDRRGEPLGTWLAGRSVPRAEIPVTDAILYRSHLGTGPARYEELARAPLRGAGSARG
jgi:2'-5' RNA ligase